MRKEKEGSASFFEKKPGRPRSKKLLVLRALATAVKNPAVNKSFFASFCSKKEALAFLSGRSWMPSFAGMTGESGAAAL
jgi:hypothetical protein